MIPTIRRSITTETIDVRTGWLLYGATGYTGKGIAKRALSLGQRPTLAGRDADKLKALAESLDLPWLHMPLSDVQTLKRQVQSYSVVLNAAGPFIDTYPPLLDACYAARTHYLDISGEVDVYEAIADRHDAAMKAGIMLMPGVGFDMVPGDCLALYLKSRLPDAQELHIGMQCDGPLSRGTILSAMRTMGSGILLRRDHRLVAAEAPFSRRFEFTAGRQEEAHATTFGDLSIAWRTTGIADITSYMCPNEHVARLFAAPPASISELPDGPSDEDLRRLDSRFVGEVRNAAGDVRRARLVTPQVYALTFDLAAGIAARVHDGAGQPGFRTAAALWGTDFILDFASCSREDLDH